MSGRTGARRDTKGSVSVCAFPLSGHHELCDSPRLNHGLTFSSECEKVGQAEPDPYIYTFFNQSAVSLSLLEGSRRAYAYAA